MLYYRKDLFKQAGLSVPATFEELENAARVLNKDGIAGFGSRGAGAAAVTGLSSYIYNYGGRYLDNNAAYLTRAKRLRLSGSTAGSWAVTARRE